MVSEENIKFLKSGGRRYIVGTPRSQLKQFEKELLTDDWDTTPQVVAVIGPNSMMMLSLSRLGRRHHQSRWV
jgi:hypothetical protein